ncbi:hypothetical protein Agabi119p4_743 [Agaricus bisporus var. burnettii]|uniref:Non-haem dioxygenase N-terminal domain-containing protein n=1 Tax=Agaricus bisporus var. burnettii TaxID=192524 RepID=A0A8H7FBK8_AGABI|nr:hypothetical protein Agabi119p4_743 [Agaricus bisporus var. burnettii]
MTITRTAEGAVAISYSNLVSAPLSLVDAIGEAFGSDPSSLGIIIVRDLPPEYSTYRERLLKLSYQFAHLPENVREKYSHPASKYSFGWSHGKEIMNGKPDILKGSYYANPRVDEPNVSQTERDEYPEYFWGNIWPDKDEKGVEGFKNAFTDLGRFVFNVGCQLATACQPFALPHLSDSSVSLSQLIKDSQTTKARLLHYFPPDAAMLAEKGTEDDWCGFHLDHSLLTGLCSAMFLRAEANGPPAVVSSPSPSSGLYIRSRGGDLTKVSIPVDCLAFQIGEALQLATGGTLRATPHCVRVGSNSPDAINISRETFALFMGPNPDQLLTPTKTYGQFSKEVFDEHYGSTNVM